VKQYLETESRVVKKYKENEMNKVFISPRKYVQGRGVINEVGKYLKEISTKPMIIWDPFVKEILGDKIEASLKESGIDYEVLDFCGESTKDEVQRIAELIKNKGCDLSVGIGGGKTLDTAKGAGANGGVGFVTVPTIASNDSPTSSFTAWYDADGACLGYDAWGKNPELVLVDSQVIANAPSRTFVAGMGDALATWVEARACAEGDSPNLAGGTTTLAAQAIAKLGFDLLLEHGEAALRSVECNAVTPAVEKVIEANILLSGLGFESGGCATAHMIGNMLPSLPDTHGMMHGEDVAFGIVVQLCLEANRSTVEIHSIVNFLIAIGLPVTLAELGLKEVSREQLKMIGDACAAEGSLCENHTFSVTSDSIIDAIYAADALGSYLLNK